MLFYNLLYLTKLQLFLFVLPRFALCCKIIFMNIETLNALEKAIRNENLLKKYHLERIGVFGSFARGEKANDIDFILTRKIIILKTWLA